MAYLIEHSFPKPVLWFTPAYLHMPTTNHHNTPSTHIPQPLINYVTSIKHHPSVYPFYPIVPLPMNKIHRHLIANHNVHTPPYLSITANNILQKSWSLSDTTITSNNHISTVITNGFCNHGTTTREEEIDNDYRSSEGTITDDPQNLDKGPSLRFLFSLSS